MSHCREQEQTRGQSLWTCRGRRALVHAAEHHPVQHRAPNPDSRLALTTPTRLVRTLYVDGALEALEIRPRGTSAARVAERHSDEKSASQYMLIFSTILQTFPQMSVNQR